MFTESDTPTFEPLRRKRAEKSDERFQCTGKIRYSTQTEARKKVRGATNRGIRLCSYLCPWCHFFHVANV